MAKDEAHRSTTIADVARIAGVSTATVSRTLSNPGMVSEGTRAAVLSAVEKTGYSANVLARNLRRRRTGGVLALAPNIANPFFSEILAGMSDVLDAAGLNLLVADTHIGERGRQRLVEYADRSRADGLLVLDGELDKTLAERPQCPPVVQVCEVVVGLDAPRVVADNAGGAAAAVAHLVGRGHARIGRVTGPAANSLTRGRDSGFRTAMSASGLEIRPEWCIEGDFSFGAGHVAARHVLSLPDRPSAMFCDNDEMACGLISAFQRAGLDVPTDMAVVGFDDIELSRHLTPALTTIRQPRRQIGRDAASMLLDRLDGRRDAMEETVPVELVVRDSA